MRARMRQSTRPKQKANDRTVPKQASEGPGENDARKRAEQLLWLEHTVARSVTEADSVAAALKAVIRTVCEAQDWECGRFFRVDEEAGALRFAEAWSKPGPQFDLYIERSRKVAYIPGVGLAGKVWQSGEPMWVADITRDSRVWQQAMAIACCQTRESRVMSATHIGSPDCQTFPASPTPGM